MDSTITDADRARLRQIADTPDHRKPEQSTYTAKPDPDEPWRYACPDCESVGIERLVGGKRAHNGEYTIGAVGQQEAKADRQKRFRCTVCNERKATLYDRKRDREVSRVD